MSENPVSVNPVSETSAPAATVAPAGPTVFFIDDSATMREVIKIAFRRENITVVTCHDANLALEQIEKTTPDLVISDVIMPDKNGYEVCQHIKQHPKLGSMPVILMSGVVNRTVAEKAMSVKADDLIRKPFQPHELITRVRKLLAPKQPAPAGETQAPAAANGGLDQLFAAIAAQPTARPAPPAPRPAEQAPRIAARLPAPTAPAASVAVAERRAERAPSADAQRMKGELMRMEHLVKKLQSELLAEREYCRALEAHIKTLQESE